ncbi:putative GNAT family N-acyltransferase [Paenibacillus sp. BK033]|uniref:GNAT family N-acetyltransferase n=1 Tax=Paenibacillus sp. BK033 TaxID=2512133 RepID=UPI0010433AD5|nr:GNAT family N-acetyltransferase [Paenibacillus sp. BK033]TCN00776.1 putative GNAT family N-acyltransferase [Paenibacillus sp. BK033]
MTITSRLVTNEQDLQSVYDIRKKVFVDEQGVPAENEYDEFEESSKHVLVLYNNEPVAAGRVRVVDGVAKLQRICVLASHRKYGLGRAVVEALESVAREDGLKEAKLNGQTHAEAFYAKLGYHTVSDVFLEEGIPHVTMKKTL